MPFFQQQQEYTPGSVAAWEKRLLGDNHNLAPTLIEEMGTEKAKRFLKRAAHTFPDRGRRLKYVRGAIERMKRINHLRAWLDANPDPLRHWMGEDLDRDEYAAYCTKAVKAERELDALTGGGAGLSILIDRIGYERAATLYLHCADMYDIETDDGLERIHRLLLAASNPKVRYPEKYVMSVLY